MKVSIYEVGPRDGLQSLEHPVDTKTKLQLIDALYKAGLTDIEETSFAHPRLVPQMADAEDVYQQGSVLVMNKRGYDRAMSVGADKINIVFSPCDTFNIKNMGKTRSEIVLMYKTFMKIPKEKVRVYISMAFGSPYSGQVSSLTMQSCIKDAKMFGNTVVFADTVGTGTKNEVTLWAEIAFDNNMTPALHLHHKGNEKEALNLIKIGLLNGIKEFDSSIGGLGGCPFTENSGSNIATETLVRHFKAWGLDCGVKIADLEPAIIIAQKIARFEKESKELLSL